MVQKVLQEKEEGRSPRCSTLKESEAFRKHSSTLPLHSLIITMFCVPHCEIKCLPVKEKRKITNVNPALSLLSGRLLSQWRSQGICVLRNKLVVLRPEIHFVYQDFVALNLEFKICQPLKCLLSHYTKMQHYCGGR